jgi:hypothetical protein
MDIKKYRTEIKLHVTPIWHKEPPICVIRFSKDIFFKEEIKESKVYSYEEYLSAGNYDIIVEFLNKKNSDTVDEKDKAVKIDKIIFNNIESEKFVWQGIYQPNYPEPWATQQKKLGKELNSVLTPITYLGWNGQWRLTYSTPIFTWIHKIKNHGWIYE